VLPRSRKQPRPDMPFTHVLTSKTRLQLALSKNESVLNAKAI
jgi:hypothetical protein